MKVNPALAELLKKKRSQFVSDLKMKEIDYKKEDAKFRVLVKGTDKVVRDGVTLTKFTSEFGKAVRGYELRVA